MKQPLTDRIALVTGAAHRVGKAIALALAAEGVHMVVHYYRSGDAAHDTVRAIKSCGVDAVSFQADQSDPQQVNDLFDAIREQFGRLDILVNNASMFRKADILTLPPSEWQRVLDVNLTGPFLCSQAAARLMLENDPPGGVIINILDNIGRQPWPQYPHHSVAKAGLRMLSSVMARRLAPAIRVNAVVPGPVLKPARLSNDRWMQVAARLPLGRAGTPEDVARAVVYLAREDFLTGAELSVDGGEGLIGGSAA